MKKEYKLKSPIVLGEETVSVLKLREPKVGKLMACEVDLSESELSKVSGMSKLLLACCTNVGDAHIKLMSMSDMTGAIQVCTDFFE